MSIERLKQILRACYKNLIAPKRNFLAQARVTLDELDQLAGAGYIDD